MTQLLLFIVLALVWLALALIPRLELGAPLGRLLEIAVLVAALVVILWRVTRG